ncbi:unnamed protein product [Gadus morhua 'NCC']
MNLHPGSLGRTRGILRDDSLGNGRLSITCVTRADVNFGRGEKPDASVKKPMTKTTKRPRAGGLLEIPRKTSLFSEALTSITAYYMLDKGAKGLMLIAMLTHGWSSDQDTGKTFSHVDFFSVNKPFATLEAS